MTRSALGSQLLGNQNAMNAAAYLGGQGGLGQANINRLLGQQQAVCPVCHPTKPVTKTDSVIGHLESRLRSAMADAKRELAEAEAAANRAAGHAAVVSALRAEIAKHK